MKAVLFDLDGTLIDSSEGITKSVQYALADFGIREENWEVLCSFIGPPLLDSFQKHYGFDEKQAKRAIEKYRERYQDIGVYECRLFDGVKEAIHALKQTGYRIGMASSKPETLCRKILSHFDILQEFDDVVGATLDGSISTKEEVLSEVFRRWEDIPAQQMCLIGDTMYDVLGAKEHQIPCVVVSFGFGNVDEMVEAGAIAVCDSFEQLPQLLDTWKAGES